MTRQASSTVAASKDLLSQILQNLSLGQQARCLTVSRDFWEEASAHVYRDVTDKEVDWLLDHPNTERTDYYRTRVRRLTLQDPCFGYHPRLRLDRDQPFPNLKQLVWYLDEEEQEEIMWTIVETVRKAGHGDSYKYFTESAEASLSLDQLEAAEDYEWQVKVPTQQTLGGAPLRITSHYWRENDDEDEPSESVVTLASHPGHKWLAAMDCYQTMPSNNLLSSLDWVAKNTLTSGLRSINLVAGFDIPTLKVIANSCPLIQSIVLYDGCEAENASTGDLFECTRTLSCLKHLHTLALSILSPLTLENQNMLAHSPTPDAVALRSCLFPRMREVRIVESASTPMKEAVKWALQCAPEECSIELMGIMKRGQIQARRNEGSLDEGRKAAYETVRGIVGWEQLPKPEKA